MNENCGIIYSPSYLYEYSGQSFQYYEIELEQEVIHCPTSLASDVVHIWPNLKRYSCSK